MIRLQIHPKPAPEEAAAIEAALKTLLRQREAGARGLRYRDVLNGPEGPLLHKHRFERLSLHERGFEGLSLESRTWREAARREGLEPVV